MKEKILIIDDSPDIRALLARFLRKAGYDIAEAHDGEDGLRQVKVWKPDLILLDIVMPGIDGYQVCRSIKGDSCSRDIPSFFFLRGLRRLTRSKVWQSVVRITLPSLLTGEK